jgi:hypothetical protein
MAGAREVEDAVVTAEPAVARVPVSGVAAVR